MKALIAAFVVIGASAPLPAAQEDCHVLWNGAVIPWVFDWHVKRVDATSGTILSSLPLRGSYPYIPRGWSLIHDGIRLLTVGPFLNSSEHRLFSIHVANGECTEIGNRGFATSGFSVSIERNPTTGTIYAIHRLNPNDTQKLYTVDVSTGQSTFVGQINGLESGDAIGSIAIDAGGVAHAFGAYVYDVDLSTAVVASVGSVFPVPGNRHAIRDTAYDALGRLWALYEVTYFTPSTTLAYELYHLDLATLTPAYVSTLPSMPGDAYYGLAFGPGMSMTTYCTAKMNSLACVPGITAEGYASPTASSGFTIGAEFIRSSVNGTLIFGASGRIAAAFGGGTLCVASPWRRTAVISSGGPPPPTEDCTGAWELDFNEWMATHVALPAGLTLQAQWIGRDPGFAAPNNWSLTDALEFTLRP